MSDATYGGNYAPLEPDVELSTRNSVSKYADEAEFVSKELPERPPWRATRTADFKHGWRFGVSLGVGMCFFVFILNITLTVWGSLRSKANDGHIFRGSCKEAKQYNMGIHIVINVLSTLVLGSSNYAMQCLCAPTRREIDRAHRDGHLLDIGVQSFRNLRTARPLKRWIWIVLAVSSLPLHLLYNSMFYSTIINNDYDLYFASEDWLNGAWYDSYHIPAGGITYIEYVSQSSYDVTAYYDSDPAAIVSAYQRDSTQFERMDPASCTKTYANSYLSDYSNVILISDSVGDHNATSSITSNNITRPSSLRWVTASASNPELWSNNNRFAWLCYWVETICTNALAQKEAAIEPWTIYGYEVSGCVSQKVEEKCSVNFNLTIGIIVIITNLAKTLCILAVCLLLTDQPLITIGDAVNSFLHSPDQSTKEWSLMTQEEIKLQWTDLQRKGERPYPKLYRVQNVRRWRAVTRKSWRSFLVLFCTALIIVIALLSYSMANLDDKSFNALKDLGFGTATAGNVIQGWSIPVAGSTALLANVLVANSPQLILSGLYLSLNDLLTRIQLAVEWASYSIERKPLRVSHDRTGAQRSTYFLQLPYRYGLPLMVISSTIHWLISQSIFLVNIDTFNSAGHPKVDEPSIATCGYSPLAMICTLVAGALVVVYVISIGARPLESAGMPLVGCSSVGIAAACHPPREGNHEQEALMWGALTEGLLDESATAYGEDHVGHCTFSSSAVDSPVVGRLYS
ncbi:hypothetical protein P153DRAFT_368944 [Dothidotthia symphoricarpi CBS 119687]|uniref:DUF6536 domain-containing protein n=1 Tax=Dothidotthia symphoricarpi CBS 119687 TaxID=1392245 RepID=A0A6A6A7Y9_9PLEO|nr:uncharacterized protein P153DRAFT_368944 [Dothidotthia symphoricarpi CBS 119687]KAF2126918.1 hypothetical protein P153DRAFT_368944 [Dothidotthia symphoricarpi CBS 119687]